MPGLRDGGIRLLLIATLGDDQWLSSWYDHFILNWRVQWVFPLANLYAVAENLFPTKIKPQFLVYPVCKPTTITDNTVWVIKFHCQKSLLSITIWIIWHILIRDLKHGYILRAIQGQDIIWTSKCMNICPMLWYVPTGYRAAIFCTTLLNYKLNSKLINFNFNVDFNMCNSS